MLLNFKFENFRSFKEETNFTMIPSSKKMHGEYVIQVKKGKTVIKTLPVAVIYGANASGKSNIILAMSILKKIVTLGTIDNKSAKEYWNILDVLTFIHDSAYFKPIKFEITFLQNDNIFRYGVSIHSRSQFGEHSITDEYLYINEDEIFTRNTSGINMPIAKLVKKNFIDNNADDYYNLILKKINSTQDSKQLFLSSGLKVLFSNAIYNDIQSWFENFLVVMNANELEIHKSDLESISEATADKEVTDNKPKYLKSRIISEILNYAEFGNQEIQFTSDNENNELSMVSLYKIPNVKTLKDKVELKVIVKSDFMESKGTIQLVKLVQPFINVLKNGGTIVLDEMDASLHFEIVVALIRVFNNMEINKNGAQLIFNTHNPIYLDGTLLRHDQIIMVKKDKQTLISELYSLSDFGLRPEERILKNYLEGKYGALPHMDLEIAFKRILDSEDQQWIGHRVKIEE